MAWVASPPSPVKPDLAPPAIVRINAPGPNPLVALVFDGQSGRRRHENSADARSGGNEQFWLRPRPDDDPRGVEPDTRREPVVASSGSLPLPATVDICAVIGVDLADPPAAAVGNVEIAGLVEIDVGD